MHLISVRSLISAITPPTWRRSWSSAGNTSLPLYLQLLILCYPLLSRDLRISPSHGARPPPHLELPLPSLDLLKTSQNLPKTFQNTPKPSQISKKFSRVMWHAIVSGRRKYKRRQHRLSSGTCRQVSTKHAQGRTEHLEWIDCKHLLPTKNESCKSWAVSLWAECPALPRQSYAIRTATFPSQ